MAARSFTRSRTFAFAIFYSRWQAERMACTSVWIWEGTEGCGAGGSSIGGSESEPFMIRHIGPAGPRALRMSLEVRDFAEGTYHLRPEKRRAIQ